MDPNTASLVAVGVSIVATLIAFFAALVSYVVFRSQADPDVVVYVTTDERRPSMLILIIENIGKASAHDVMFTFSREMPSRAFGIGADAPEAPTMHKGPLISGIPFLPPGGKRVTTWGQYGGLVNAIGDEPLVVTADYWSRHYGVPWKTKHTSACPLEVRSFAETDANDHNYLKHIAEHTKDIANSVGKLAR